jgi:hypothetical protein
MIQNARTLRSTPPILLGTLTQQHAAGPVLLVFGCLACAPSKECCRCLLTKFGLAYLRRGFFGGWPTSGVLPLISSTPCRCIRSRLLIRDQLKR